MGKYLPKFWTHLSLASLASFKKCSQMSEWCAVGLHNVSLVPCIVKKCFNFDEHMVWTPLLWALGHWTLGLWTHELWRLGRLDSGILGAWTLDAWNLDAWTQDDWYLESRRLGSVHLHVWTLDVSTLKKLLNFRVKPASQTPWLMNSTHIWKNLEENR